MQPIIENIKYAIRNNETVKIGGGEFSPDDLQYIIDVVDAAKIAQTALQFSWGGEPLGTIEKKAIDKLNTLLK